MTVLIKVTVLAVEERFQTVMKDGEAYGNAKTEGQAADATEKVSAGWWLVLQGWGVALHLGASKPPPPDDFAKGDLLSVRISKGSV